MDELKDKGEGLEAQVGKLTAKVLKAKEIDVVEFQKSDTYKLMLNTVAA